MDLLLTEDFSRTNRNCIQRVIATTETIFGSDGNGSDNENEFGGSAMAKERRIIVANQLPIRSHRDLVSKKWCFNWDTDALIFQLKDGFATDVDVFYVGCLDVEIEVSDQEETAQFLLENFHCVPTFLPINLRNKFYHGFCKNYLWPIFHYMLPVLPNIGARFDRNLWQAYVSVNKIFAEKIVEVINPDFDYVWIHDYHLLILPTFLRKRFHQIKLGFFLHSPFPSSEIYRTLPIRDHILRALLNSDLIGFHTFDYARHFLSCCSRRLGLDYESKRGHIGLEYYGRTVNIKILPVGIHMGQLDSILSRSNTAVKIRELKDEFDGKFLILGVDDMDMFKGINLKFLAMDQLLEQHPELIGRVVLVQITNPARTHGKDIDAIQTETRSIAQKINEKYGKSGYDPTVLISGPVSTSDKVAYYTISDCCVVNAVRDGMNLVPYNYTVCRQGSSVLDKELGFDLPRTSVIIVSEFIGCSPSLSGAIRVNPWDIEAVSDAINLAIKMPETEKHLRHEKHYKYISSHDVTYWARSFDQDLKKACREHLLKTYWAIGFGLDFRVVALDPNFRKLSTGHIMSAYKRTNNRLILLNYDGTMLPKSLVDKTPSNEVILVLNELCSDPKNVVFVVSGRRKDCLSKWFSPCEKLGISAEHGYFTRWTRDSPWETCGLSMDFEWKKIAEPVMELYTERTDGSFTERQESASVWHHQDADPDFGSLQAKELLKHLESLLINEPVVVKRGQHIVEVKPQGVSKAKVVEAITSTMTGKGKAPDFVLCVGDDRSDEDMFESIARSVSNRIVPSIAEVFACTVGQKPSMAKYYLDDTVDVIKMLQGLAMGSEQSPKSTDFRVCFEGSL